MSLFQTVFDILTSMRRRAARRRLLGQTEVEIAPDAKVAFERIRYRPGSPLRIGAGSIVESAIAFDRAGGAVSIGCNTFIGGSTLVCAERIDIGDDVLIAWGCTIVDHDSHSLNWSERKDDVVNWYHKNKDWTHVERQPIEIRDKAWIGLNVLILKGVSIGEGAVVGAGSVVTKDVPPYSLVAGNPARIINSL